MRKPLQSPAVTAETKSVSLSELYPLMREILADGGSFTLTVTGTSMVPFLLGGRDRVTLSPVTKKPGKNDLPLYRREDGTFVLHRIIKVEKTGTYTMCGDHQTRPEKGVRREQIVAVATAYTRKGRHLTNQNPIYRIYRTVWTLARPVRSACFFIDRYCHAWMRRLSRNRAATQEYPSEGIRKEK